MNATVSAINQKKSHENYQAFDMQRLTYKLRDFGPGIVYKKSIAKECIPFIFGTGYGSGIVNQL
jgi:hypothetical protein